MIDNLTQIKPKVLIVHNYYQIPGGEDTVVANEKQLLENNGHEVILYSRNNSELKTFSKLQKLFLPVTTVFSIKTYREVKRIIKDNKIEIIHVHNTLSLVSPSVYYAAFAYHIPVVQTVHNFRLLCPGATFYRNGHICEDCINKSLKCAVRHKCYRNSKLQTLVCAFTLLVHRFLNTYSKLNLICLTEFNKGKLLDLNKGSKQIIDPDKIFVKPNFAKEVEEIIPFEQRKNQFIYAGRLEQIKGIRLLFEAWKEIKTADLIICGTGPEEEWCQSFIKNNHINNVIMMGHMDNAKVREIIAQSKALILPTQLYEGFPMVIVEAYSSGTSVIGSDIGNVGNLIQEGVSGQKFKFNSVESIVKKVMDHQDMVKSTKATYIANYTADGNYKTLLSIYETAIERIRHERVGNFRTSC